MNFSLIISSNVDRLAGAVLLAPAINYWWSSLPANLTKEAFYQLKPQDQWVYRISHYIPWLTYWWNTQRWFPSSSVIAHSQDILSRQDKELVPKFQHRIGHMVCIQPLDGY